jgi:hypothetical protein
MDALKDPRLLDMYQQLHTAEALQLPRPWYLSHVGTKARASLAEEDTAPWATMR